MIVLCSCTQAPPDTGEKTPLSTEQVITEKEPLAADETDMIAGMQCDVPQENIVSFAESFSSALYSVNNMQFSSYPPLVSEDVFKNEKHQAGIIYINNTDYVISDELYKRLFDLIDTDKDTEDQKRFKTCFYVSDLYTGMSLSFNAYSPIISESLIKAAMGLYVIKQIESGEASFDDKVVYNKAKHYKGGGGTIKYSEDGSVYTVRELMEKMITISDNVAYMMIHSHFGYEGYNEMISSMGCTKWLDHIVKFGYFRACEMGIIWREIYRMYCETETGKWYMELLKKANHSFFDDSMYDSYTIAHKAGWGAEAQNESGVVFAEHPYTVAVLTGRNGNKNDGKNITEILLCIDEIMKEYFVSTDDYIIETDNNNGNIIEEQEI